MKKNSNIDRHLGKKLKQIRKKHKLTQAKLGEVLGVSHQQVQQYEIGDSRVAASTLFEISNIFNVQPNYFFEDIDKQSANLNSIASDNTLCTQRYKPLKILIVEDNPPEEVLLREAIKVDPHETVIYSVSDGEEAIEFIREHASDKSSLKRPDIIFLDLNLPKISGIEVLKFIKKNEFYRDIQTIVFTNSINPEDMDESYKLFSSSYIKKSDDFASLCDTIGKTINYWHSVVFPSMQYE
jgi:transcriptional regulator with XRE-family HTH domain